MQQVMGYTQSPSRHGLEEFGSGYQQLSWKNPLLVEPRATHKINEVAVLTVRLLIKLAKTYHNDKSCLDSKAAFEDMEKVSSHLKLYM